MFTLQARSRRSVAGKDIMLDPRAGIRKAGAMGPLMALLKEVTEVCACLQKHRPPVLFSHFPAVSADGRGPIAVLA